MRFAVFSSRAQSPKKPSLQKSAPSQAKRFFIHAQPDNSKWTEQQHECLKALIPRVVACTAQLEELTVTIDPIVDMEKVQSVADLCSKIEDDFQDVKASVQRLLGKRLRRGHAGQGGEEKA